MSIRDPLELERAKWRSVPRKRPDGIERPGPGEVSVWSYPRPPRLEVVARRVRVVFASTVVADTKHALRLCETASPPTYYLPCADVNTALLSASPLQTLCEWKGVTCYWSLRVGERSSENAAWSYPEPDAPYAALRDHLAFHAGRVDTCTIDGIAVRPQPGDYYGGWITPELRGPFKGEPGSESW